MHRALLPSQLPAPRQKQLAAASAPVRENKSIPAGSPAQPSALIDGNLPVLTCIGGRQQSAATPSAVPPTSTAAACQSLHTNAACRQENIFAFEPGSSARRSPPRQRRHQAPPGEAAASPATAAGLRAESEDLSCSSAGSGLEDYSINAEAEADLDAAGAPWEAADGDEDLRMALELHQAEHRALQQRLLELAGQACCCAVASPGSGALMGRAACKQQRKLDMAGEALRHAIEVGAGTCTGHQRAIQCLRACVRRL